MFDGNMPITTMDKAKEFYIAMSCNGFHMCREYPERYDEFKALNISKKTTEKWRKAEVKRLYKKIMKDEVNDIGLWVSHYLDLIDSKLTVKDIKKTYRLLKAKYKKISPLYIIIACSKISNTTRVYPFHCVLESKALGLNNLYDKYYILVKKMVKYACDKDPSLTDRAKHILNEEELIEEMKSFAQMLSKYQKD
ncbi:MAG: hypothetical protein IJN65_05155 [Clostridia bacterium]|nr:hypothetical protein [Clostridia bacterium]